MNGRICSLKSVLSSLPLYDLPLFKMPKVEAKQIIPMKKISLWHDVSNEWKICKVDDIRWENSRNNKRKMKKKEKERTGKIKKKNWGIKRRGDEKEKKREWKVGGKFQLYKFSLIQK